MRHSKFCGKALSPLIGTCQCYSCMLNESAGVQMAALKITLPERKAQAKRKEKGAAEKLQRTPETEPRPSLTSIASEDVQEGGDV